MGVPRSTWRPSWPGLPGPWPDGLPFTLSLSCGTWGGNITTENVNARHFVNLTWVSRPIPPHPVSEEELFAAYWERHGR